MWKIIFLILFQYIFHNFSIDIFWHNFGFFPLAKSFKTPIVVEAESTQSNGRDIFLSVEREASKEHGHLERTAYKLSATKIEHSHWSTGHSTQL